MTKRDVHDETTNTKKNFLEIFLELAAIPITLIEKIYKSLLPQFIRFKWVYLVMIFMVFAGAILTMNERDKILLPKVDQGQFMLKVDLPVGTRVEFTDKVAKNIENYLSSIEEIENVSSVVGSSKGDSSKEVLERLGSQQAQVIATLRPDRSRKTSEVVQEVREYLELSEEGRKAIFPARLGYVLFDSAFKVGGDTDAPVVINIKGPDLGGLKEIALDTQEKLGSIPGIYGVSNSIADPSPETKIIINKDRASYYRLSVTSIAQAANMAIKGFTPSKFKEEGGREVDIRIQLQEKERDKLRKLEALFVRSPLDLEMPLVDFVKFQAGKGPSEIKRESQERTVQVYAKINNRGLKEVTLDVQELLKKLKHSSRYTVKIAGENLEVQESFASLQFAFILSIVLVYMIMASQFESLYQPFLIMFCVPLSLIGVAVALWASNTPISVVVILGVILLGGIVVNNGIILIDFINQLRAAGTPLMEAVMQAGRTRLRPILMTAFSSAIGLAPLALGAGEGNALQAPMAVTVMGGILIATFLTLVVTPALYVGTEEFVGLFRKK